DKEHRRERSVQGPPADENAILAPVQGRFEAYLCPARI
ncbi:MAG: hypothetical protein AVDCRST_MAG37-880, partial [uncultured Rubrobacteraceae bacterium]